MGVGQVNPCWLYSFVTFEINDSTVFRGVMHLLLLQHFIYAVNFSVYVQRMLKDLAKGLVRCDFSSFPENLRHMVSLWPMQIPRENRKFWFTSVKCTFQRGDLH